MYIILYIYVHVSPSWEFVTGVHVNVPTISLRPGIQVLQSVADVNVQPWRYMSTLSYTFLHSLDTRRRTWTFLCS